MICVHTTASATSAAIVETRANLVASGNRRQSCKAPAPGDQTTKWRSWEPPQPFHAVAFRVGAAGDVKEGVNPENRFGRREAERHKPQSGIRQSQSPNAATWFPNFRPDRIFERTTPCVGVA